MKFRISELIFYIHFVVFAIFMAGCVNSIPPQRLTCGVLIREHAKHRTLTSAEYEKLEPKLAPFLQRYGLTLVRELLTADRIATGVYEADLAAPFVKDFVIHSITPNTINLQEGLRQSEYSMLDASQEASSTTPRALGHPTLDRDLP